MTAGIKGFILRGLAAGAVGGIASALFLRIVTETQIGFALRFEDAAGIGLRSGEEPMFDRATQHVGGMAAAVIYGAVLGIVLGIVLALVHHRVAGRNEFERAAKVSAAAFLALVLIPSLKYPPNPPTVGDPDTINDRTTDFLLLLGASVIVVFVAWRLWMFLTDKGWDGARRFLVGGGALLVMVTGLFVSWPASPDPIVPPDNESAPALVISEDAPKAVLSAMLETAKATGDGWIRDPDNPLEPLDLDDVDRPEELRGLPAAVSTTKLVDKAYTTVVWHFRVKSIGGLALMWVVMATVFGLLADRPARQAARAARPLAA